MPRKTPIHRPVIFNPLRDRAERFAEFSRKAALGGQTNRDCRELSALICWVSAIEAARRSGAISNDAAKRLNQEAQADDPDRFAPATAYTIWTQDDWENVAPGCFVVFIGAPYTAGGPSRLSHVMVSLGQGWAVGSNNAAIGGSPAWTAMDLSPKITWANNSMILGGRAFEVRVRDIEDKSSPDCFIQ